MVIQSWLEQFRKAWVNKDVDAVVALFSKDVEYWETPHRRLASYAELGREWQAVRSQNNIELEYTLFSSVGQRHTVIWRLAYHTPDGQQRRFAGTYLIRLNDAGLCTYFHHTGEAESIE